MMTTTNNPSNQTIKGFLVQHGWIQGNNIDIVIEKCAFCGERHSHGTGNTDWGDSVETFNGIRTLGHRAYDCVQKGNEPREIKITLPNGHVVTNLDGWYLAISNQQPNDLK